MHAYYMYMTLFTQFGMVLEIQSWLKLYTCMKNISGGYGYYCKWNNYLSMFDEH